MKASLGSNIANSSAAVIVLLSHGYYRARFQSHFLQSESNSSTGPAKRSFLSPIPCKALSRLDLSQLSLETLVIPDFLQIVKAP